MPDTTNIEFLCGQKAALLPPPKLSSLILQASDARQTQKAQALTPNFGGLSIAQQEWLLFSKIFRSLGYGGWQDSFEAVSEQTSAKDLQQAFQGANAKQILLGRWAGAIGLLGLEANRVHPSYQADYRALQAQAGSLLPQIPQVKGRPQNHPLRRLTGLFYHLQATASQGLVKSWLKLLWEAESLLTAKQGLKEMQKRLSSLFPTPSDEPLAWVLTPQSQKLSPKALMLIGEERQRVILVNAVIPFFLAYAQHLGDRELEKTLFALFVLLPAEGGNFKTIAMEQRLLAGVSLPRKKSLSHYQGLIQLYDDWCSDHPQCQGCGLVRLL